MNERSNNARFLIFLFLGNILYFGTVITYSSSSFFPVNNMYFYLWINSALACFNNSSNVSSSVKRPTPVVWKQSVSGLRNLCNRCNCWQHCYCRSGTCVILWLSAQSPGPRVVLITPWPGWLTGVLDTETYVLRNSQSVTQGSSSSSNYWLPSIIQTGPSMRAD